MAGSNFQSSSGFSSLYIKPFKKHILNSGVDVLQWLLSRLNACFVVIWSAVWGVCAFSSPVLLFEHWASFKLMYWYITCFIEDKSQNCSDLYLNFSILCSFNQPFTIPIYSALQKYSYPFSIMCFWKVNVWTCLKSPAASNRFSCFWWLPPSSQAEDKHPHSMMLTPSLPSLAVSSTWLVVNL